MNLPFKQHVLICTGPRCGGERNSYRVRQEFRKEFVRQSLMTGVKDTECICFGLCGRCGCFLSSLGLCKHGPIVIVYPEGIVYSGVKPHDVAEIVREHLVKGKVIERLLYRRPESPAPEEGADEEACGGPPGGAKAP